MQDDDVRSPLDPDTPLVPFNGRVVVPWLARDVAAQLVGGSRVALATTAQGLDLTIQLETPESARRLRPLRPERVTRLEAMLFDTFIQQDDGYERDRFLLTATVRGTRRLAGLIFWRNIHSAEMRSWLDPEIADLSEAAGRAAVAAAPGSAPAAAAAPPPPFGQRALVPGAVTFPVVPLGGWVQIELVATNPSMRGQGIGKLLLALALAYAVVRSSKRSALLLVAGGRGPVPQVRLRRPAEGLRQSRRGELQPPRGLGRRLLLERPRRGRRPRLRLRGRPGRPGGHRPRAGPARGGRGPADDAAAVRLPAATGGGLGGLRGAQRAAAPRSGYRGPRGRRRGGAGRQPLAAGGRGGPVAAASARAAAPPGRPGDCPWGLFRKG
eukprot:TRINITY_DN8593_c0_g1_i3.p1 TRINITY_DN8593_c0_g1~~TRINITY_DN8593_c0_g1_i3.p1  ORF type:complete len:404 (+),score=34.42 TRINITY_DN8593_c0_g1_i3:68-1213(+)